MALAPAIANLGAEMYREYLNSQRPIDLGGGLSETGRSDTYKSLVKANDTLQGLIAEKTSDGEIIRVVNDNFPMIGIDRPSREDADIAQKLLVAEAGAEFKNQIPVACVLRNRMLFDRWPSRLGEVCKQRGLNKNGVMVYQFEPMNPAFPAYQKMKNLNSRSSGMESAAKAIQKVFYEGYPDITKGADHFWSEIVMNEPPWWSKPDAITRRIGGHVFEAHILNGH